MTLPIPAKLNKIITGVKTLSIENEFKSPLEINLLLKKKIVIQDKKEERKSLPKVVKKIYSNNNFASPIQSHRQNTTNVTDNVNEFKINGENFKKFLDHYEKKAYGVKENIEYDNAFNVNYLNIFKTNDKENTQEYVTLTNRKNKNERKTISAKVPSRANSEYKLKTTNSKNFYKAQINKENIDNLNEFVISNNDIAADRKSRPMSSLKENDIISTPTAICRNKMFGDNIKDFIIGKEIGKGAYAIVRQAVHRPSATKLVIKIYEKFKLMDPAKKSAVKKEIQVMKQLDHPNIVKLFEVIDTPKQIWLIMELVQGVSLLSYIKSKPYRKIIEPDCKFIFSQIIKGINYLHCKNIYHRDIKLENILINDKNEIKIIDFGFGTSANQSKLLNFFCGTPSYMPPEIVQKKDYLGSFADIWSIGILLFILLSGSFPFRGLSEKELYSKIIKGIFIVPDHISSEAKNLIHKILIVNPHNRITSTDILSHDWLTSLNKENTITI